jgi:hypothetical protein
MLPNLLTAESFNSYPPEAKLLVVADLSLLQRLPLGFLPLLLREAIVYDWKFPAERRDIDGQFAYLRALPPEQLAKEMSPFVALRLSGELEKTDWVGSPAGFTEQLTAHLWTTHQIDDFRTAAVDYVARSSAALPADPLPAHRLGIVAIGQGVGDNRYRLFRKLRPQGAYFTRVRQANGLGTLVEAIARRASEHPLPFGHWYIDGEAPAAVPDSVACVSYATMSRVRAAIRNRMQKIYEADVFDPELFRTKMAQTRPEDVGLSAGGDNALDRFRLSLLTEGSGTQVFATTFVQWAAREALRRAQPLTLFARFTPRQRENPMNELLAETRRLPGLDPQGSLVDADMGAYYTWLNQQRLSGSDKARFLVWFEDHGEAVAIGPGFERNQRLDTPVELADLVARVS